MESKRELAKAALLPVVAFLLVVACALASGADTPSQQASPEGPLIATVGDFNGDGVDDIRLQNEFIWLQLSGQGYGWLADHDWISSAGIVGEDDLMVRRHAATEPHIDGVYCPRTAREILLVENSESEATYQLVTQHETNDKHLQLTTRISLRASEPLARITHEFSNTGTSFFQFREPTSHIGYGHMIGFLSVEPSNWRAFVSGAGDIDISSISWWTNFRIDTTSPYAIYYRSDTNRGILHGYRPHDLYPITHVMTHNPAYGNAGVYFYAEEHDIQPGGKIVYEGVWAAFQGGVPEGQSIWASFVQSVASTRRTWHLYR